MEDFKTIGLIGGMSWESTVDYYKYINKIVNQKLGKIHSAKIQLHSVDYQEINNIQQEKGWSAVSEIVVNIARKLESSGADCILICCNTVHMIAEDVQSNITIPFIHIADAVGEEIKKIGLKKVALLGTKTTMEGGFFKERLKQKFDVESIIPNKKGREYLTDIILNELCKGVFLDETRKRIVAIIDELALEGAEGVILGCTELPMLIRPSDCKIKNFDTTLIHATSAVNFAFSK